MKNQSLVDIYNKDSEDRAYSSNEHIHAKHQRTKDEVLKDRDAFMKAITKYCDVFIKTI
jgi:hypothetical protein